MGDFFVTNPDDPTHASSTRGIAGQSCAEVFDALALFAAMSLDPGAVTGDLPALDARSSPAATEPAPGLGPASPAPNPAHPRSAADLHPNRSSAARTSDLVGLHLGATSAGTPSSLLLVEPFVEVGLHRVETLGLFVAPALRLGFSSTGADTASAPDGFGHIHWTVLRLDACPPEIRMGRVFSARPCLAASGGRLSATGEDIAHPNTQRLPWASLGGLIRAQWNFLALFVLEIDGGFDVPLRRDRLYFDPSTPVYRAPAAMARVSLGVGLHFP